MTVTLPEPLIRGTTSSRTISDLMRDREPRYESMFEASNQGLKTLGHFYIPPFQRPVVWTIEQQRRLVESIWLGISIGSIVVSAEGEMDKATGKYALSADLLLDGLQRLTSLKAYMQEGMRIFVGTQHEHCYEDLDLPQQRRFRNTPLGYITIDRDFDMEALKEIYNRLNFGGTAHTEDQRA